MQAVLRSGIAPNRPRLRLDPPPEKAPERPCTAIPGRRDHSAGPDRVRPARGDVCRDSCTVPISRPCTTTHGSVRAGSSPCRRGGSRFKARPIGGRLVNAPRRATGWSWGATPAPRPGPRSAGRRGGGPSLADSRRGSTGRRVRSARRWRRSSRPTGTVGDDDGDGAAERGGRRRREAVPWGFTSSVENVGASVADRASGGPGRRLEPQPHRIGASRATLGGERRAGDTVVPVLALESPPQQRERVDCPMPRTDTPSDQPDHTEKRRARKRELSQATLDLRRADSATTRPRRPSPRRPSTTGPSPTSSRTSRRPATPNPSSGS